MMLVVCTFPSFRLIYSCSYWLSRLSNFKSGSCYNFLSVAMHCSSIGTILQFFYNLGCVKQNALYVDSIFNKKINLNTVLCSVLIFWTNMFFTEASEHALGNFFNLTLGLTCLWDCTKGIQLRHYGKLNSTHHGKLECSSVSCTVAPQ